MNAVALTLCVFALLGCFGLLRSVVAVQTVCIVPHAEPIVLEVGKVCPVQVETLHIEAALLLGVHLCYSRDALEGVPLGEGEARTVYIPRSILTAEWEIGVPSGDSLLIDP